MDSFFLPFLAAAIAEWGDKTQILAMALAIRFARPAPILVGITIAAAINMSLAAFGGSLLVTMITPNAALLFLALAFFFAAISAFIPFEDPETGNGWSRSALFTSLVAFLAIEFGDKTQFIAAGFGAASYHWAIAALGATLGIVLSCAPAVLLAGAFRDTMPIALIRRIVGGLLLVVSSIIAINAFELI